MPDQSGVSPFQFACRGGLVLNLSTFDLQPGMATELVNFEPDINGGYRRINGFDKWNSNIVPQTSSSDEKVLMVANFVSDQVIAARGEKVFKATDSASWTEIDSGRTGAGKYSHKRFNFDGTDKIIWVDGANHASVYDDTTVTDISASPAPSDPSIVEIFKNHVFLAGASSNPQELFFSAPYDETDFTVANGGGSIAIDDTIVQLKVFRDQLYIFGREKIFRLVGSTVSDFQLQPVTRNIGCVAKHSVQELGGDIVFLAPDGLRTVAGTERIGDVELGTISRAVQVRFDELNSFGLIDSVVIPNKTQYRIFFVRSDTVENATRGVIASQRADGFEFSDIQGIRPACTDSDVQRTPEVILHGGFDGYVYEQEVGNDFDGSAINAKYRSPDLTLGDAGIRKNMQRVILNYAPESAISADMFLRYDYESPTSPRPAAYPLDSDTVVAVYGISSYGTATYGGQRQPLVRQPVEGSGFAVAIRVNDNGVTAPYSLKGFQIEFSAGARR